MSLLNSILTCTTERMKWVQNWSAYCVICFWRVLKWKEKKNWYGQFIKKSNKNNEAQKNHKTLDDKIIIKECKQTKLNKLLTNNRKSLGLTKIYFIMKVYL